MATFASDTLRQIALFAELPDAALACIAEAAIERRYPAGALILLEGVLCEAAYFILAGEVSVYRMSPQGRQQVLVQLGPGEAFNIAPPLQSAGLNAASVEALNDVTLLLLHAADFRRLLREWPDLAQVLLADFAERLAHLTGLASDLALYSVRGRLARFLLEQEAAELPARWTHEEIAAHIGSVREVVSRTLRAFVKEGLLKAERQRITVVDHAALEREAEL